MPAKHGITTNQWEYLSYTMVKPFDLLKQHGTSNSYTMGRRDLPDIYTWSLQARGLRVYISGKFRAAMV